MEPVTTSEMLSVVLSASVLPSGLVTTVVMTSPATALPGKVMASGVPPALAASAALTPPGASLRTTEGAEVSMRSSPVLLSMRLLPAASVVVAVMS